MNAIVVPEAVQSMTPIERAKSVLKFEELKSDLIKLAEDSKSIVEVKDAASYEECHGARMQLKNMRVAIEKTGKDARADATAFGKAVIKAEDELIALISPEEKRLQILQDAHDAIAQAEKDRKRLAEEARIRAENAALDEIRNMPLAMVGKKQAEIEAALDALAQRDLAAEFDPAALERAKEIRAAASQKLRDLSDAAGETEKLQAQIESERAERAAERAQQAEREAADRKAAAEADEARKTAQRATDLEREHIADIQQIPLNCIGQSVAMLETNIVDVQQLDPSAVIADPVRLQLAMEVKAETVAKLQHMRDQAIQAEADRKAAIERDRAAEEERQKAESASRAAALEARMSELKATAPPLPAAALDALALLGGIGQADHVAAIRLRFAIERDRDIVARLIGLYETAADPGPDVENQTQELDFAREYIAAGETATG